jgi:hypothetical protein
MATRTYHVVTKPKSNPFANLAELKVYKKYLHSDGFNEVWLVEADEELDEYFDKSDDVVKYGLVEE